MFQVSAAVGGQELVMWVCCMTRCVSGVGGGGRAGVGDVGMLYDVLLFQVSAAVGGQESTLFAEELVDMYQNYAAYRGWRFSSF